MEPLSREFLLNRGHCCNNGCKNCPYRENKMKNERLKKMFTKEAGTGWVIFAMFWVFVGLSIEPFRNNREEFIRIMVMVLGGGVGSTIIIMWFFNSFLPTETKYKDVEKAKKLQKELDDWANYSDIAFDNGAQQEYSRIEKELKKLEIK